MENLILRFGARKLKVNVRRTGFFSRFIGLMFRTKNTENLLFEFSRTGKVKFTGLFVFFPFYMIWLNDKNKVLGHRLVRPFEFVIIPSFSFKKVVEIPVNEKNGRLLKVFRRNKAKI